MANPSYPILFGFSYRIGRPLPPLQGLAYPAIGSGVHTVALRSCALSGAYSRFVS